MPVKQRGMMPDATSLCLCVRIFWLTQRRKGAKKDDRDSRFRWNDGMESG